MGIGRDRLAALISAVMVLAWTSVAGAAAGEYELKAAFIYNFTQFITWPAEAFAAKDSPFVIAVIDEDPFGGALDQAMAGKNVAGHPIVVQHVAASDGLNACDVLFVPQSQDGAAGDIVNRLGKKPVLLVGESEAFLAAGGGIRLYLEEGRMRFEVDPASIESRHLQVSAKLLKLARIYRR